MVWVGLCSLIVAFSGHTNLLFSKFVLFSYLRWPHVASSILCHFLTMVWVGLWSLVVAISGQTYLLYLQNLFGSDILMWLVVLCVSSSGWCGLVCVL